MRTAASLLLCVVLTAPALAGTTRLTAPNSRNDDSPIVREVKRVVQAVKSLGHLIVSPLDDPDISWPKP